MPLLTQQFDPSIGPIITVEFALPASIHIDENDPPPREAVNMLIDTGASATSMTSSVADNLGLPVLGLRPLTSVTETAKVREYLADMYLPIGSVPYHLTDLRIIEFPMGNPNVGGLLGRDLLQYGMFHMNGASRIYTIGF